MSDGEPGSAGAESADWRQHRRLTIVNSRGLHARAAAKFVKLAAQFDAEVTVRRKDMSVSGLSIMGLMMLAATCGAEIEVEAEGAEAGPVLNALEVLVLDKFGEDREHDQQPVGGPEIG